MTARTVPALPNPLSGQKTRASYLDLLIAWANFWANPPEISEYQSTSQSVPNTTYTQITCNTAEYDTDSGRMSLTPYSYTIPTGMGGRWRFEGMVSWAGNATGARVAAIFKNGAQVNGANVAVQAAPAANVTNVYVAREFAVSAGDVITLYGWQNSGGALSTQTTGSFPSFLGGRMTSQANP